MRIEVTGLIVARVRDDLGALALRCAAEFAGVTRVAAYVTALRLLAHWLRGVDRAGARNLLTLLAEDYEEGAQSGRWHAAMDGAVDRLLAAEARGAARAPAPGTGAAHGR